jgi:hypothetical protein
MKSEPTNLQSPFSLLLSTETKLKPSEWKETWTCAVVLYGYMRIMYLPIELI